MAENVGCDMHQRSARRVEAMTACRIAVQLAIPSGWLVIAALQLYPGAENTREFLLVIFQ